MNHTFNAIVVSRCEKFEVIAKIEKILLMRSVSAKTTLLMKKDCVSVDQEYGNMISWTENESNDLHEIFQSFDINWSYISNSVKLSVDWFNNGFQCHILLQNSKMDENTILIQCWIKLQQNTYLGGISK